jgi:CubicO group peptidase (beta-lactamase class C family)
VGQVAVGWDGHVQFERSYGAGRFYDIGPVTEAFTAEAVYKLVEEKRLSLTTTLGELFSVVPPDKHGITIEQLLAQTSGLGNTYAADRETDRDAAVAKLLAQPLAHAPGELFTPSDDGYVILAAVIDVASGVPYETYLLQSGVVAKDMTSTVFWGDWGSRHTYWGKRGSDGILSTAHDLCLWASRFVDQSDYAMNEIVRPRVWTEDGLGIGYGWFMDNTDAPLLWTNGVGESDHNVMVVVYPSNVVLAVSSDRIKGDATWSELVANALEPVLREFVPPSHDGQIRPLAVSEAERH